MTRDSQPTVNVQVRPTARVTAPEACLDLADGLQNALDLPVLKGGVFLGGLQASASLSGANLELLAAEVSADEVAGLLQSGLDLVLVNGHVNDEGTLVVNEVTVVIADPVRRARAEAWVSSADPAAARRTRSLALQVYLGMRARAGH